MAFALMLREPQHDTLVVAIFPIFDE